MTIATPTPIEDRSEALRTFAPTSKGSQRNSLLAALAPEAAKLLQKHLREQDFREGAVLWDAGEVPERVFFPISGSISIRVPGNDGHAIEVASVGHEAAAGLKPAADTLPMITQGVVEVAGRMAILPAPVLASAARQFEDFRRLVAVSCEWLLLQSQQMAACNAAHSADTRFCRWLLRASDALAADVVPVTQETIAQALGIRRTTATLIAQQLQAADAIGYSRGKILIRDRSALQAAACDCYAVLSRPSWPSEVLRASEAIDEHTHYAAD